MSDEPATGDTKSQDIAKIYLLELCEFCFACACLLLVVAGFGVVLCYGPKSLPGANENRGSPTNKLTETLNVATPAP
jgi:hypothetical protein